MKGLPAVQQDTKAKGEGVVQTLEATNATAGYPDTIRLGQGSEIVSQDLADDLHGKQMDHVRGAPPPT